MNEKLSSFARLDRSVRLFLYVNLVVGFAFTGIQLVLMNLYLASLGFNPVLIGNVNGIGTLAWALSAIPAGLIGARLGLRGTTAAGYGMVTLGTSLFMLTAPLLPADLWPAGFSVSNLIS